MSRDAKLYIVMRSDLGMGRGKEIAQAIHAYRYLGVAMWAPNMPVICVRADGEPELRALIEGARCTGAAVSAIHDAGLTHNQPGTLTCCAIGPVADERGPLLSAARLY